jgi:hypothetical protein
MLQYILKHVVKLKQCFKIYCCIVTVYMYMIRVLKNNFNEARGLLNYIAVFTRNAVNLILYVESYKKHIHMCAVLLQNEAYEIQDKNSDCGPTFQKYSAHSDFQHWYQHRQAGKGKALPIFPLTLYKMNVFFITLFFFQVLIVFTYHESDSYALKAEFVYFYSISSKVSKCGKHLTF